MCLRPIYIADRSVFHSSHYSSEGYDVPCGCCAECRALKQQEWETRISFEISDLYSRGGKAIFLTFTYSDATLPHYKDKAYGIDTVAFRHKDVLGFLNRLKVTVHKLYGKSSYKYFFVSEYGKETRRPHYHALFFLEPEVDYVKFTETARSCWSYGYTFPKFNKHLNTYVDNLNLATSPLIRSKAGGSCYVAKYITKDMSFFGKPDVSEYIQHPLNKLRMKEYLPKHWQSNGLGSSIVTKISHMNEAEVKDALCNGIVNPLSFKRVPLPSYAVNKLFYKSVKLGRVNSVNKPLYDRILTPFAKQYMQVIFVHRVNKTAQKMFTFFHTLNQKPVDILPIHWQLLNKLEHKPLSFFVKPALYHHFLFHANKHIIHDLCQQQWIYDIDMFKPENVSSFWFKSKDPMFRLRHPFGVVCSFDYLSPRLNEVNPHSVVSLYHLLSRDLRKWELSERQKDFDEKQRLRRLYASRYNTKYC